MYRNGAITSINNSARKASSRNSRPWMNPIVCITLASSAVCFLYLSSFFTQLEPPLPPPAQVRGAPTALELTAQGANEVTTEDESKVLKESSFKPVNPFTLDQSDIEMAEFAYENQKGERNPNAPVFENFAKYDANWPCFWGETAIGDLNTWKSKWGEYKDGWKYVCGLTHITEPCVVYSLGSSGNMAFEKDLLRRAPFCEIHIFDMRLSSNIKPMWFTPEQFSNVVTHEMFISTIDNLTVTPPHRSVPSIMAELGHDHIDILKMDIEGAEWGIFSEQSTLNMGTIGQLQLEVHTNLGTNADIPRLFEYLEMRGLRLFHKELNWRYGVTTCMEYAFIQKEWSPSKKIY